MDIGKKLASKPFARLVEIRAAQIKAAHFTNQLAAVAAQFGPAVRTEHRRIFLWIRSPRRIGASGVMGPPRLSVLKRVRGSYRTHNSAFVAQIEGCGKMKSCVLYRSFGRDFRCCPKYCIAPVGESLRHQRSITTVPSPGGPQLTSLARTNPHPDGPRHARLAP